ncbi:MAG: Smr/MutS family protein [Gemmatimonadetes bacterium]|nr:Smr/MutS family protein [Gemmatimonadota bacterium]
MGRVAQIRIKDGMPTVAEARKRLAVEIEHARRRGVRVLKLIHGYGSSGVGGRLRAALRRSLAQANGRHGVGRVVFGENWSIFDEVTRSLLDDYPELRRDPDLDRLNAGLTIVEVR